MPKEIRIIENVNNQPVIRNAVSQTQFTRLPIKGEFIALTDEVYEVIGVVHATVEDILFVGRAGIDLYEELK